METKGFLSKEIAANEFNYFLKPVDKSPERVVEIKSKGIAAAQYDTKRIAALSVDFQNTFVTPGFELVVPGATIDLENWAFWNYYNLEKITRHFVSLDTHDLLRITHPMYWVDKNDEHVHPGLFTQIDVENFNNPWVPNPRIVNLLGFDMSYSAFIKQTKKTIELLMLSEKQPVIIWPYHGINYELGRSVPFPLGELLFVHSIARDTTPYIISKGEENNIESYGAFAPDIIEEEKYNEPVLYDITDYDAIIIAGEASTHCVKYTLLQLIDFILNNRSNGHVAKIYVAKDCMSPVPGFEDDIDSIIEQHEFVFGVNLFVDGPIDVELLPEM